MHQDPNSLQPFWDTFMVNGKRQGYTEILNILRLKQVAANKEFAADAKHEYGDQFNEVFRYRKRGRWVPLERESDIARKYLQLKGIVDEDRMDESE